MERLRVLFSSDYFRQAVKTGIALIMVAVSFLLLAGATVAKPNSDGVDYRINGDTITLSWGEKPTAGYKIDILGTEAKGNTLIVTYSLTAPAPGDMVAQVITYPQDSAKLPDGFTPVNVVLVRSGSAPDLSGEVTVEPQNQADLPVVGSRENLLKLLEQAVVVAKDEAKIMVGFAAPQRIMDKVKKSAANDAAVDYSGTNVQVQGVDEGDVVKTDGTFIYRISEQKVVVIKAVPASAMQVVAVLDYKDTTFRPVEIYVDKKYIVVVGESYDRTEPLTLEKRKMSQDIMPYIKRNYTQAIIYEITDKTSPRKVREVELEGRYVSSRKVGSSLYLVANKGIFYPLPVKEGEEIRPLYRDSALGTKSVPVDYDDIRYLPGCIQPNYIMIAGLDLSQDEPASISSYLGSGENIYCSENNLYVPSTRYQTSSPGLTPRIVPPVNESTLIFRFGLDKGRVTFEQQGEVPGTVLNQFSLDEYQGRLRVATTTGAGNNIYILDDQMKITGRLEDIAPGERIYSARFMGKRVYLVTFKQVDPFFVIDLSQPDQPEILGALKIPGYSDYLHPYDDNHVIGFGKDTILAKGWGDEEIAYYTGMKVALFDVTDVSHPVEMFKQVIGDRGTESELLRDHHALLFSRERGLLVFPVKVMQVQGQKMDKNGVPVYGTFSFQGAYVYHLDLKNGFKLKARITHLSDGDYKKAGNSGYNYRRSVERAMYIGNTLYTLSPEMIKAHSMDSYKEIGSLTLPSQ